MSVSKSTTNKEGYAKYAGGNRHHENNKVVIIESDMEDDMLKFAFESLNFNQQGKTTDNQTIAQYLKEEFEKKYSPTWNCIVGKKFGFKITSQVKHYACLERKDKDITIVLYKFR
jgi:dynein light chain LC8-type